MASEADTASPPPLVLIYFTICNPPVIPHYEKSHTLFPAHEYL